MRAIRIHSYGGPEVIRLEDVPVPEPGPEQVLIRVAAAALNPVDWSIRSGHLPFLNLTLPVTLGCDVSGVVEKGSAKFQQGDKVYGFLVLTRLGAFAEYAIGLDSEVALKPKSVDFAIASTIPVAALTSWEAIFDVGELQPGQTILIHGASGAVGSMAVQLAKWKGARVIGTASGANLDYLRELGVDEIVDYKTEKFEDKARNVDVVFDPLGGETQARSFQVLRKDGFLVSLAQPPSPEELGKHGVRGAMVKVKTNGPRLAEVASMIDHGILKTRIDREFPLEAGAEALKYGESGQSQGRVVLKML